MGTGMIWLLSSLLSMSKRHFDEATYGKEPRFKALVTAFLQCKSSAEMTQFLRDIATLSELHAFSERLEVARLLLQGKTYRTIAKQTGASTTTVTRVAAFLERPSSGYRIALSSTSTRSNPSS